MENVPPQAIEWLQMKKSGSSEQAEKYYEQSVFPLVEEKFLSSEQTKSFEGAYDTLIIPVGAKWHYAVLEIKAVKPKRVYFIATRAMEHKSLDEIIRKAELAQHQVKKDIIEYAGMDLSTVYEKIRGVMEQIKGERVAVDLSRGKRVMTAGIGIAASLFDCDFIYVDEQWDAETQEGVPCTESLMRVGNPFKIHGELEKTHARELFNHNDFQAAAQTFEEVSKKVRDPRESQAYQELCNGFLQWDLFNYRGALYKLSQSKAKAQQYSLKFPSLDGNFKALEELTELQSKKERFFEIIKGKRACLRLVCDAYCNAMRRAENNKFDEAVGRLYRALEIISQHRLALRGIDCANPDYSVMGEDDFQQRFAQAAATVFGKEKDLPAAIALLDGHIMLFALGDELWKQKGMAGLYTLSNDIKARDHSMSAHGIRPVDEKDFLNLRETARSFIEPLFAESGANWLQMQREHVFPKI